LAAITALPHDSVAQTKFQAASLQNGQALVDSSKILRRAHDAQLRFERRRRQMLPRFSAGTADHCLIVGRFCEWHSQTPDEAVPAEGEPIRAARRDLLRELEKANAMLPGDDWIVGERIRYMIESRDSTTVSVARSCEASKWWCDALLGLALHMRGEFAAADSAYSAALAQMPELTRCHWLNLAPLLDDEARGPYKQLTCAEREIADARIWLVADPLYMTPGNERRTEHFSRVVHTALYANSENTYGLGWGGDLAELTLRFGWAEKWTREPSPLMYSDGKVSITGHEREPGFHFFTTEIPPDNPAAIGDSLFDLKQFPPREQYAPIYARAFESLDAQVARFRRGDSTRVVAAYDVGTDTIFGRHTFAAAVVALGDEAATPSKSEVLEAPTRTVLSVSTPLKSPVVGVELLANDSAGAARWRGGFTEIPVDSTRLSVSDLLFVDGGPSLPADLEEAIPRAHGGTKFRRDTQVGLFWELYGRVAADSALPVSLTITPVNEGLLRRAFRVLRIVPKVSPLNIRWRENGASGMLSPRSVLLDLSHVPPGMYAVKLEVGKDSSGTASRTIEVK
jgi:hypothetical protein